LTEFISLKITDCYEKENPEDFFFRVPTSYRQFLLSQEYVSILIKVKLMITKIKILPKTYNRLPNMLIMLF
jgi:hypothetical protein